MFNSLVKLVSILVFQQILTSGLALGQTAAKQFGNCSQKANTFGMDMWEIEGRYFWPKSKNEIPFLRAKSAGCFEVGQQYKISSPEFATEFGMAPIQKIEVYKYDQLPVVAKAINQPEEFLKTWFTSFYGEDAVKDEVALIHLGPIRYFDVKNKYFPSFAAVPHLQPKNLEVIPANKVAALVKSSNARLIDLRTAKEFQENHIPGAINIPYVVTPEVRNNPDKENPPPAKLMASLNADNFDWKKLPDKTEAFIFYGSSLWDLRAKRFNINRFMRGYRNLRWIRGGFAEFRGDKITIPNQIPGIKVVSVDDVRDLVKKGAQFVDVRPAEQFSNTIRFMNSINVPYTSTGYRMSELSGPQIEKTVARLGVLGERFDVSKIKKGKPVVLYSWNEYEDASWKAALFAKKAGHDVYLWRDGLGQWWARCNLDSKNYSCDVTRSTIW